MMYRRDFLKKCGVLSAGVFLTGNEVDAAGHKTLGEHTIDRVEFGHVKYRFPRKVGRNARIGLHGQHKRSFYTKIYTDQGASGWGLAYVKPQDAEALKKQLLGKTVDQVIIPSKGVEDGVHPRAFDIALHDLAGIILGQPVYKMLGADGPKETKIYSGMIYFDEMASKDHKGGINVVMENCRWDYNYGYRQLKVKIGRSGRWYSHDEGLAMDIKIVKMIHEEFGEDVEILVDANDMYSLQDTIDFLKGVEGVPIYWMEEPFVETLEKGRKLKDWMMANGREETFYAEGELDPQFDVCFQLAKEGKLDVFLADIVDYGMSSWRKIMPDLIKWKTYGSPHAWGNLLKTHYAAHVSAGLGNVCTVEGVTCISDEIDYGDYKIIDGKIRVSEKPGFGMKLVK